MAASHQPPLACDSRALPEKSAFDVELNVSSQLSRILGVYLPHKPRGTLWDVSLSDGRISSITPGEERAYLKSEPDTFVGAGRLLAPSLCHAHIHLDKCFLLQEPKYEDLQLEKGDFQEAMSITSKAKARFEEDDLLRRGRQLIKESIAHGVTAMRAFVEVDSSVGLRCLTAGVTLKQEFVSVCEIQICAFAQLSLFSSSSDDLEIRDLMLQAMDIPEVDVIGSTPYVEDDEEAAKQNIQWMIECALEKGKMLDFHLDYNVDASQAPMTLELIRLLKNDKWIERGGKGIVLGHCTRLTLFSSDDWNHLKESIEDLPISFVGLPTSDLYMMKTESTKGTLNVPTMIKRYGFKAAIAVNNIGNAFTPYGSSDPLSVAQLGVGLYQTAARQDVELLYVGSIPPTYINYY